MFRLLAALLVVVLPCLLPAQAALFQVLDAPVPGALGGVDAVADFDGDGDMDLLGPGGIAVNDSHGRFTLVAVTALAFARGITIAADLNGDGLPEVVSTAPVGTVGAPIRIDRNLGGLAFQGPALGAPTVPSPQWAVNLAIGDVDGDGDLDILIATKWYSGPILAGPGFLWLNDGSGSFTAVPPGILPTTPLGGDGHLALRDLDGDGDLDALFVGSDIRVLTNTGTSMVVSQTIAANPFTAELGNFNGDAFPDLVYSYYDYSNNNQGAMTVHFGSASGFLPPVTTLFLAISTTIQAVDLNGDGIDEIVEQGGILYTGASVRPVTPAGVGPPIQAWLDLTLIYGPGVRVVRDLDGDLDRDVLASAGNGDVLTLMNDAAGGLVRIGGRVSGAHGMNLLQLGDVDADGDRDLIGYDYYTLATALNDGDGNFTGGPTSPFGSFPTQEWTPYAFDRDGDGDADLYSARNSVAYPYPINESIFDNTGGGVFVPFATLAGFGLTVAFEAADFDGDGDQDIVLGHRGGTTGVNGPGAPMELLKNLGTGGFAAAIPIGSGHATWSLEVADFDGNGSLDVFQANVDLSSATAPLDPCVLYLNGGLGTFTAFPTAFASVYAAAGDLTGDGLPDVVLDTSVLVNIGAGSFAPGPPHAPLVAPITLADVDGDGDLDVVETPATVLFNNGALNFGPPISYLPRGPIWNNPESAVFDADRDGDVDIVAPGPIVLLNTTRQIAHGSIARPGRPASIDLYGTPGGAWFLWGSSGTTSLPLPPFGTVLIDPASAQLGAMGTFTGPTAPIPGTATLSVLVPNNPALVGWTTWWQSVDAAQMRLTNRLAITVLSY